MTGAAPTDLATPAPSPTAPAHRRRPAWLVFGLLWAVLSVGAGVWGLATPLMGSPDEQSHAVKAAAVVRGELTGYEDPKRDPRIAPGRPTLVLLPETYSFLDTLPRCHAFRDTVTANCRPALDGDPDRTARAATFAGRYPPLYYSLVGWPSLVSADESGLYAMRALSGIVASAFLAGGLLLLVGTPQPRLALLGAGVALTPMALSLTGVINPSALEISCAFCAWSALLAAVLHPDPDLLRTRLLWATVSLAVMVNLRASAPLFGLLLVLVVVAVAPWPVLRDVVRRPVAWVAGAVGVVAGSLAAAWVLLVGTLEGPVGRYPELARPYVAAREATGRSLEYLRQMVGVFGWLDAPAPGLTFAIWFSAIGTMLVVGLAVAGRLRPRLVLLAFAVALFALPIGLQLPGSGDAGLIWQGRYLLPLAIGLPLLCGLVAAREQPDLLRAVRLDRVVVPALVVAHVGALYWMLRRYAVGADGALLLDAPEWQPPLGIWPLLVLHLLALLATVLLLRALSARPTPGGKPA